MAVKTVNEKIEACLADLVDGNIWPLLCPLETLPDQWITYQSALDDPEDFGDDKDLIWVHHMQIHWFHLGQVDYYPVRNSMRARLKGAGFTIEDFTYLYHDDPKSTHLVCECSIMEDLPPKKEGEDDG